MKKKVNEKTKDKLSNLYGVFSIFIIPSFVVFGISVINIENYKSWLLFIILTIIFGVFTAIIFFRIICKFIPEATYFENKKGYTLLTPIIFNFILLSFGGAIIINELKPSQTNCKKYVIEKMEIIGGKHSSYYIWINKNGNKSRLNLGKAFYQRHFQGDSVNLCSMQGFLGFEYDKLKN